MKRLASVLLFLGIAVLVFGSVILYMEKAARQRADDVASTRFIRVYTDMPADFIQTVGQAFARKEKINIVVVPLTTSQILDSTLRSDNTGDVVITSQEVLQQLSEKKELAPYSSPASDTVMHQYRAENDTWTGIWIDPVVFAVNRDFYAENPDYIYTWDNVVTSPMTRLSVTDFVSSSEAEDLLYSMSERFGEDGAIGRLAGTLLTRKISLSHILPEWMLWHVPWKAQPICSMSLLTRKCCPTVMPRSMRAKARSSKKGNSAWRNWLLMPKPTESRSRPAANRNCMKHSLISTHYKSIFHGLQALVACRP